MVKRRVILSTDREDYFALIDKGRELLGKRGVICRNNELIMTLVNIAIRAMEWQNEGGHRDIAPPDLGIKK